jgi:hypothetical protein
MMAVCRARQGFLTCRRLGSSECALDALREFIISERDALAGCAVRAVRLPDSLPVIDKQSICRGGHFVALDFKNRRIKRQFEPESSVSSV